MNVTPELLQHHRLYNHRFSCNGFRTAILKIRGSCSTFAVLVRPLTPPISQLSQKWVQGGGAEPYAHLILPQHLNASYIKNHPFLPIVVMKKIISFRRQHCFCTSCVYSCCKVGHVNTGVYGGWLTVGARPKWPFETLMLLTLVFNPIGCCLHHHTYKLTVSLVK